MDFCKAASKAQLGPLLQIQDWNLLYTMSESWTPPESYATRPVAILGGGVLGRRIACCWASAGYTVHIRDPSEQQRADALAYIRDNVTSYAAVTGCAQPGGALAFADLPAAVANAWLVFEAVPEILSLKTATFAELERHAPGDALLCSNSSSYKSGEMLGEVSAPTRPRILNTHYMMPPANRLVELMTCGFTAPAVLPWLAERHREAGLKPHVAAKESTGFIFNRVWAAVKREVLMVLAEGVTTPAEVDEIWVEMFAGKTEGPCRMMDDVGLDTVAFIEEHYIQERGLPSAHVEYLRENYTSQGKLGRKSTHGGLLAPADTSPTAPPPAQPKLLVLDLGLSQPLGTAKTPADIPHRGRVLELSADGTTTRTLADAQPLPDGLVHDPTTNRLYWTNMGDPSAADGSVLSSALDGSDLRTVVPPGAGGMHTPKQLALDARARKLYIADREGMAVHRCGLDGAALETVVRTGDPVADADDHTHWCVGVAVAPGRGELFWTQKGASKAGQGRLMGARLEVPDGCGPAGRTDVRCLLEGLPEPIDLEVEEGEEAVWWTDRGEVPWGNTLNRLELGAVDGRVGGVGDYRVVAQNFDEAIGLKIDGKNGVCYVADIGGTIWRCGLDGRKEKVYEDKNCAFSGLTVVY
ncbi:hypothetical protein GTA08_BOTSDO08520 [Neofusicoccum parvum]|nr:hypothetical protein GTA08_BOTSDO08520 [Neofusicoccum parvum]